jgi:predicted ATPase
MPPAKLEKLQSLLARAAPPAEDVALLADLLSLPASERRQLPDFSPPQKKQRTLEALMRQLEGLARQQPVVMIFEDAHWVYPTSRELAHHRAPPYRAGSAARHLPPGFPAALLSGVMGWS